MKNLLGLLVVALVVGFALTREDENGQSFISKMTSEEGTAGNINKAEEAANAYGSATQARIEAEFGTE